MYCIWTRIECVCVSLEPPLEPESRELDICLAGRLGNAAVKQGLQHSYDLVKSLEEEMRDTTRFLWAALNTNIDYKKPLVDAHLFIKKWEAGSAPSDCPVVSPILVGVVWEVRSCPLRG